MEKGSLTKLLNGVLLKKYPCINTIYVSYNDLDTISYSVNVYVISKNNKKDYLDCKEVYNEIKEDIIDLSESMGIYINNISQAGYHHQQVKVVSHSLVYLICESDFQNIMQLIHHNSHNDRLF